MFHFNYSPSNCIYLEFSSSLDRIRYYIKLMVFLQQFFNFNLSFRHSAPSIFNQKISVKIILPVTERHPICLTDSMLTGKMRCFNNHFKIHLTCLIFLVIVKLFGSQSVVINLLHFLIQIFRKIRGH